MDLSCPSFLILKKSVIRIRNKDLLCLARALVTDMARQEKHPDWNSIRLGRQWQSILAKELHQKAGVPEGLCGLPEVTKFQRFIRLKITRSLSYQLNTSMLLSLKGPRGKSKSICTLAIITSTSLPPYQAFSEETTNALIVRGAMIGKKNTAVTRRASVVSQ